MSYWVTETSRLTSSTDLFAGISKAYLHAADFISEAASQILEHLKRSGH
jgi:hypothetical protein